ncbi:DUF2309 domain-containing protein [Planctomicrobium piriforme]|uniref:Probable inorganic carbon transporter subunit DabA n=1 Tax=Planctomicrobium piriforme TaxID=1576369 RepID=A0A1I3HPB5_9PLAN|nr:DUF2309 domain-containing protein [Planctomicrobium piriforme]SFI37360.1 hypothetical protein SAMN05421753_108137 [Planctomicrobium piriforme]
MNPATTSVTEQQTGEAAHSLDNLQHLIEHVAHLLPSQGPITVFVHHNTLHAYQNLPFAEALKKGVETYSCEPFLAEEVYHEKFASGRIRVSDLETVLREDLGRDGGHLVAGLVSRFELRLAMSQFQLQTGPTPELEWLMAETNALRRFRSDTPAAVRARMIEETRHWALRYHLHSDARNGDPLSGSVLDPNRILQEISFGATEETLENWTADRWEEFCLNALWRTCLKSVSPFRPRRGPHPPLRRHRDILLRVTSEDSDQLVDDLLIRFTAAFLDQGLAQWEIPNRELGLYGCFLSMFSGPGGAPDHWLKGLRREAADLLRSNITPIESIQKSLQILGIDHDETEVFLTQTLLALRGWSGIIWQTETRTDRVVHPSPAGTLIEFLAIRLILERHALSYVAKSTGAWTGPLAGLHTLSVQPRRDAGDRGLDQRAFYVFQLAQLLGWSPETLGRLGTQEWRALLFELDNFNNFERRRILHLAFERRYRVQALDALTIHAARPHQPKTPVKAQVITCIDDREESFRRQLEELSPDIETFGAPGFFAVVMYYQGAAEAHYTPLCPIVVRPQHWVQEDVVFSLESSDRFRRRARKAFGQASHHLHVGSRTFAIGAVLATVLGPLASLPMISRILFPRHTARVREAAGQLVRVPTVTQLRLERTEQIPGDEGDHVGFTVLEMAGSVERLLRDIGLISNFAPLVVILGHGSSSHNNPHESAYNCGACAGSRGGPNARAMAQMANDPRIRDLLSDRGIVIPDGTVFVGGYHNTCDDEVEFFNLDRLPTTHHKRFHELQDIVDRAREKNALERCRRFESAPLDLTPEQALRHVEARAEDLSQARPEYNHATNAICYVGRRQRTRSLFMDRRAFLQSYDPTQDDAETAILMRILQAAVPVCAGINLEYYFSTVDPVGWGCGNKLPHNIVSLLGVMEGAQSDLRTGLSAQMVEIHEPVRILFIIETTPEAMLSIMRRNEGIREHIENDWVQLAVLDPHSPQLQLYVNGQFVPYEPESTELPEVATSYDWFRGWRDHLGFASIQASEPRPVATAAAGQERSTV